MFKKIQRVSDSKFLLSLENNTWVDNIKESTSFKLNEFGIVKNILLETYKVSDLIIHTNYQVKSVWFFFFLGLYFWGKVNVVNHGS